MTTSIGNDAAAQRRRLVRAEIRRENDGSLKIAVVCLAIGIAAGVLGASVTHALAGAAAIIVISTAIAGAVVAYIDLLVWTFAAATVASGTFAFVIDPDWPGHWEFALAPALAVAVVALNIRLDQIDRAEGSR